MKLLLIQILSVLCIYQLWVHCQTNSNEDCLLKCNDLKVEILTMTICRDAKRTLPRPKVGDTCSIAMEQGFNDACNSLCRGEKPVSNVNLACRQAALEMPRPTVRKWCEHGYSVAYDKVLSELGNHFTSPNVADTTEIEEVGEVESISNIDSEIVQKQDISEEAMETTATEHIEVKTGTSINIKNEQNQDSMTRELIATIPVNIKDISLDIQVYAKDDPTEVVTAFCREHLSDDLQACLRQLLPTVLERLDEIA